jgi:ferrous iron transport protein B
VLPTLVATPEPPRLRAVALAGNPNAGKTTVFNALTGLRQKVANYAGVTVTRKSGMATTPEGPISVIDLPGTYSLNPTSPDEHVAAEVLRGVRPDTPAPDAIVCVVDAANLARNLLLFTQVAELGRPVVVALTMSDMAERMGRGVDAAALEGSLGVPVVPIVAHRGLGVAELRAAIDRAAIVEPEWRAESGDDPLLAEIAGRYRWIDEVVARCRKAGSSRVVFTERVDGVVMHPVWGLLIFAAVMAGLFFTIFVLADPLMNACQTGVVAGGRWLVGASGLGSGLLGKLLRDGVVAGVGAVLTFVPQIALLFLLLGLLEDSGYLARAAFLVDRLLARVGLHGKSFIPLLSSFACAIPGIMAARTIESRRDRLATILVAPFMSCSARLPVYLLLVSTFFSVWPAWGRAALMLGLYTLGIAAAAATAWAFSRARKTGPPALFILEMPQYQLPKARNVGLQTWQYTGAFVRRAGTIIFALSVLIWAATAFPALPGRRAASEAAAFARTWTPPVGSAVDAEAATFRAALGRHLASVAIAHSFAGRLGRAMEPVIAPLGFDWKMGVGLVGAFAAREVFVSTLGIVYSVGDPGEQTSSLSDAMRGDRRPDGSPVWTPLVGLTMLVWFVLAMQCVSTTAVVRRETGGWRWPLVQLGYMNALAYACCLLLHGVGLALGL